MRPGWLWDTNISVEEIQKILRDTQNRRFVNIAALLLSRENVTKEIFAQYLDQKTFVQNWQRIKRQMRKDSWNNPRIVFWQAVYEKLVEEFKEKGIAIRSTRRQQPVDNLTEQIAEIVRTKRKELGLTQVELAERMNISQQTVSHIEQGRNDMRISTLNKVFRFLGHQALFEPKPFLIEGKIAYPDASPEL